MVSEETRAISVVVDGEIKRGLSLEDLRTELERIQLRKYGKKRQPNGTTKKAPDKKPVA